jgi:hypothetical protein
MNKYVLAGVLVAAFTTPALAEQFHVAFDGKRCEMFSHKPKDEPPRHLQLKAREELISTNQSQEPGLTRGRAFP